MEQKTFATTIFSNRQIVLQQIQTNYFHQNIKGKKKLISKQALSNQRILVTEIISTCILIFLLNFRANLNSIDKEETNSHTEITQSNTEAKVPPIFHIDFSTCQKQTKAAPLCVSCVRFSSTACALNPGVVASCQPCSSCFGMTCQLCLSSCRGCCNAVCGNCSIDIEAVNGHKAEMFIACLGCRDRFEHDNCDMDMG